MDSSFFSARVVYFGLFLRGDFINFKNKSTQSFRDVYKGIICMYVFMFMSMYYMSCTKILLPLFLFTCHP
jgi:hypothetical protein